MAPSNHRRPGYSRKAQYGLFWGYVFTLAGALVAAAILALSIFDPATFGALRVAVAELTAPASTGVARAGSAVVSLPSTVADYFAVRQRNAALRRKIDDMHALVTRARAVAYENRRLKQLLRVREPAVEAVATARLVSSSASSTRRFAILNAGFRQGVQPGQPARGPEGLVGRVVEAGPNTARVLLLSDTESVVPVRRRRDGLAALVVGRGDGMLEVRTANLSDGTLRVGDTLVTSGIGGIYAPNMPVGQVVRRNGDTVLARPFALPDSFDYVIIQRAYLPQAATPLPPKVGP